MSLGDLANASFLSTQVTKNGQAYALVQGTRISLRFWDSRLSAQAGCNILGGDATLSNGVIDVAGGLSTTEMGLRTAADAARHLARRSAER